MYYETKTHQTVEVQDAIAAAAFIRSKEMRTYHAIKWNVGDRFIYAVPDGHADEPLTELAVIEQTKQSFKQIESLTNASIESTEDLAKYLKEAEDGKINMGATNLILGAPTGKENASFTCGCCGEWFKSNVLYQQQFDQDDGYGICKPCERYYL